MLYALYTVFLQYSNIEKKKILIKKTVRKRRYIESTVLISGPAQFKPVFFSVNCISKFGVFLYKRRMSDGAY